ncbi:hypothetical protein D3C76_702320 [compost metagenome]
MGYPNPNKIIRSRADRFTLQRCATPFHLNEIAGLLALVNRDPNFNALVGVSLVDQERVVYRGKRHNRRVKNSGQLAKCHCDTGVNRDFTDVASLVYQQVDHEHATVAHSANVRSSNLQLLISSGCIQTENGFVQVCSI